MVPKFLLLYGFPIFIGLILWEIYLYKKHQKPFPLADAGISLTMALTYGVLTAKVSYLAAMNDYLYSLRLFTIPTDTLWGLVLLFFGAEFAYYWLHRCAHEIRWLWASHSVHHSPETMTFSGAYRLGLTGAFSGLFVFFIPLFLLGFSPQAVATMYGINLFYQFFLHTEWVPRLGWYEYFFNTPSHHRVHHATNDQYIDKNYGGILIIFDRIFGTIAVEQTDVTITYGLLGKAPSHNPLKLFFQEWIALGKDVWQAEGWRQRLLYAFGRPGWKPVTANRQVMLMRTEQKSDVTWPETKTSAPTG